MTIAEIKAMYLLQRKREHKRVATLRLDRIRLQYKLYKTT